MYEKDSYHELDAKTFHLDNVNKGDLFGCVPHCGLFHIKANIAEADARLRFPRKLI